jgi:hypothetical protein
MLLRTQAIMPGLRVRSFEELLSCSEQARAAEKRCSVVYADPLLLLQAGSAAAQTVT